MPISKSYVVSFCIATNFRILHYHVISVYLFRNICQLYENHASIIMPIVFDLLPFNNPDGGVWKQGYLIETSDEEWQGKILKGIVLLLYLKQNQY